MLPIAGPRASLSPQDVHGLQCRFLCVGASCRLFLLFSGVWLLTAYESPGIPLFGALGFLVNLQWQRPGVGVGVGWETYL